MHKTVGSRREVEHHKFYSNINSLVIQGADLTAANHKLLTRAESLNPARSLGTFRSAQSLMSGDLTRGRRNRFYRRGVGVPEDYYAKRFEPELNRTP